MSVRIVSCMFEECIAHSQPHFILVFLVVMFCASGSALLSYKDIALHCSQGHEFSPFRSILQMEFTAALPLRINISEEIETHIYHLNALHGEETVVCTVSVMLPDRQP